MNPKAEKLAAEIKRTRAELRAQKKLLKHEANPVRRIQRSWKDHRMLWLGGVTAVTGTALALWLRGRSKPKLYIPKEFVVVSPTPPPPGFARRLAGLTFTLAKPLLLYWANRKAEETWGSEPAPTKRH